MAQVEMLMPMEVNHTIQKFLQEHPGYFNYKQRTSSIVSLPFFDDFSSKGIYPRTDLWLDNNVYINNTFGYESISIGVATFDGFDSAGAPYGNASYNFGIADYLTSQPINLEYSASDSIYLSFFVQPQGNGRRPDTKDSLILEFKSSNQGYWIPVKRFAGTTRTPFQQILIPITDPQFLYSGFQFRFKNKGSLLGGDDHWHIDYLELDRNRSANDTLIEDVSFNAAPTSLLNSYSAIPYNQFSAALIADNHFVNIKNNFSSPVTVLLTFEATDLKSGAILDEVTRGEPFAPNTTQKEESRKFTINPYNEPFDIQTKYYTNVGNDNNKFNDTVVAIQHFGNYFSYDDGSAENGYGIYGGAGRVAFEFNATNPDTLREVQFFFTRKQTEPTNDVFTLTIWKSINPEEIVYQKTSLTPAFGNTINGFVSYVLDSPIIVGGQFYVGWVQSNDFFMNVGLDVNNDNRSKLFYRTTAAGWEPTSVVGSPMIRPVFSDEDIVSGINNNKSTQKLALNIYPNPAGDYLYIDLAEKNNSLNYQVRIIDLLGQTIYESGLISERISVADLSQGLYLVRVTDMRTLRSNTLKFYKN